MKLALWIVLAVAAGAVALYIYQQRRLLAAAVRYRESLGGAATIIEGLDKVITGGKTIYQDVTR